jgi:hypothetical protein
MTIVLEKGKHYSPDEGMCLMEAVSFIAGGDFTDHPKCVSPVLASFGIALNDFLSDDARQRLVPTIPFLTGTVNSKKDKQDGLRCAHWLITHWLPAWLDLVPELKYNAIVLREIPMPKKWPEIEGWLPELKFSAYCTAIILSETNTVSNPKTEPVWSPVSRGTSTKIYEFSSGWNDAWNYAQGIAWDVTDIAYAMDWHSVPRTIDQLQQDSINLFTELVEGRQ